MISLLYRSFYSIPLRYPLDSMDEYCKIIDDLGSSETAKNVIDTTRKICKFLPTNMVM